jgi:hypothetical protein
MPRLLQTRKAAAIGDHADVAVNAMAKRANVDPPSPGAYAQRRTIVATRPRAFQPLRVIALRQPENAGTEALLGMRAASAG